MSGKFQTLFGVLAVLILSTWAGASFAGAPQPPNGTIPEPTTLLLIGAGVGAAALARRLRK